MGARRAFRFVPDRFSLKTFSALAALLFSVFLLTAGNGLIAVLAPLRASLEGFSDLAIGLLGSAYFGGMLAGTFTASAIVRRVGHIRAFAALLAVGAVAVILMPDWVAPAPWMAARGALGFIFAGVYAIIDSWINGKASNANRGALYAIYQLVAFVAQAGGQLSLVALAPASFAPFSLAGALLALAIAPMAMTSVDPPVAPRSTRLRLAWLIRLAPAAALGAFIAGVANSALFALGPVYALKNGMTPSAAPLFCAAIVVGSALGVYPAGRLSDRIDRRLVMAVLMGLGAAVEILLAALRFSDGALILMGFLVGLTTYTLYTLAASHANDRAKPQDMVAISLGLLFVNCVGATVAPTLVSALMRAFGPSALFAQAALVHLAMVGFALRSRLAETRRR
jgi:MFS family permease